MEFIETSVFRKEVDKLLSLEELKQLQIKLLLHPYSGDIIQRTGGLRKMRWAKEGIGKSGGLRIIYYPDLKRYQIFLLLIYPKSKQDRLTPEQEIKLKKWVQTHL